MFIPVDFTPVASRSSTTPIRSSMSRLRAWTAIARDSSVGALSLSMIRNGHASACQFTGGDQADGAGADDHDVGVLGVVLMSSLLISHLVETSFTLR